jgi:hypothetical protein
MCLVSQIEQGERTTYLPPHSADEESTYHISLQTHYKNDSRADNAKLLPLSILNKSSSNYPWGHNDEDKRGDDVPLSSSDLHLAQSIATCLNTKVSIPTYKPHHYFDYIGGTSTGG